MRVNPCDIVWWIKRLIAIKSIWGFNTLNRIDVALESQAEVLDGEFILFNCFIRPN